MQTTNSPKGDQKALVPYLRRSNKTLYFLLADYGDEDILVMISHDFTPKEDIVAFRLKTDEKAPKIFWDMLRLSGQELGLTAEEVRVMLGLPREEV